jgi:hypothetical protein
MLRKAIVLTFFLLLVGSTSAASAERLIKEGPCVPIKPVSLEHLFGLPKFVEAPQEYPEGFIKSDTEKGEGPPYQCDTLVMDARAGGTHSDEIEGKAYANGHAVLVSVREEYMLKSATSLQDAGFATNTGLAVAELHQRTLFHPFRPIPLSGGFKPSLYGATSAVGGHENDNLLRSKGRKLALALYVGVWTRPLPAPGPAYIELQMRASPSKPVGKWFNLIAARVIPGLLKHAEEIWNAS